MKDFQAKRITQTGIMTLAASPRRVFPLLCPKREYDWIPIWQCDMIFSETGYAEDNGIFYTDFREDRGPEWWVVTRYEPCRAIEFIRFATGVRITRLDVRLAGDGPDRTIATWTQTMTALSLEGNSYIDRYNDASYRQEISHLETMLNHYLQTGTMVAMPGHGSAQEAQQE
jgi:hypothetical protein